MSVVLQERTSEVTASRPVGRVFYLDVLRIYAIICVVLLHALVPLLTDLNYFGTTSWLISIALNPFCRTGVAIFLMISGHLLLNDPLADSFGAFYKKRIPRLVIPLLIWNVIYYVYYALVWDLEGQGAGDFFTRLFDSGTAYHMWYVYTLIGIYLLTPFLKKITYACSKRQLTGFLFVIISMTTIRPFINAAALVNIHLFDPLIGGYIGFFVLGYLLGSTDFMRWQRLLFYLGGIVGCIISFMFIYSRSTPEGFDFSINAAYSLPRFLVAAAVFVLSKQLFGRCDGKSLPERIFSKLAGLTFGIYWLHVIALMEVQERLIIDAIPIVLVSVQFVLAFLASAVVAAILRLIKPLRRYLM